MKKMAVPLLLCILLMIHVVNASRAESACSKVVLVIAQSLTLERVAFDAKLVLTNNLPGAALENIRLDLLITDKDGNSSDALFFVRKPDLSGISALDGTGIVAAGGKAEAHWLIIPSPGSGVVKENGVATQIGVDYWVGATLTYSIPEKKEVVPIAPTKISVKPMPELVFDYFMPYVVIGDNPFTPQVEPPVPYPLAVRVLNDGYGPAMKLKIDTAQPKIVENDQGLLIDFKLLGASVNDSTVAPLLTVNFGDVGSKKVATAYWQMISSLTGRFTGFKAEFSHASELGGELTSLIQTTNPHYLAHMIKVNLPGRDDLLDFLALDSTVGFFPTAEHLPDTIFESEIPNGSTNMADARKPVTVVVPTLTPLRPTPDAPDVQLSLPTDKTGWIYTKLPDPADGMLNVVKVVRGDGVQLDPNNFWVDEGIDKDYRKTFALQLVDYRNGPSVPGTYTVSYVKPEVDTTPPDSSLIFDGPVTGSGPYLVATQTRLVVSARDNGGGSGVEGMLKKVAGQDDIFVPAYPFSFDSAGTYTVEYYATDRAGNVEATKTATVIVVGAAPSITAFSAIPSSFAPQAPPGVKATRSVEIAVTATSPATTLPVEVEIAAGSAFQADKVVRTLKGSAVPGSVFTLPWDGKDASGKMVSSGPYVARLKVSDGLDNPADPSALSHTATRETAVTVVDWFAAAPIAPNPDAEQLHPDVSGTRVVWQELRNGNWDIYLKDTLGGAAEPVTANPADQEYPAIDGSIVVWQDRRSGSWEIYGRNLASGEEFPIATGTGDKQRPVLSGSWVAWQDRRNGNWDIYAYNLSTQQTVQITSHERDQLHPAIAGTTLVWEDCRLGLGQIYKYDLATGTETRVTLDQENQTQPNLSGATMVWTDERNGKKDIYSYDPLRGSLRVTYATGDHNQAAVLNDLLVYTDYQAGLDDPNLSFQILSSGTGGRLTSDPARQEEPAIGTDLVVWQDNRAGANNPDRHFQIYVASLSTEALPIEAQIKPGFNLLAVGDWLASQYSTASALIAAKGNELGIGKVLSHDPLRNTYSEATATAGFFPLVKGMGLVVYAQKAGTLKLADSGETFAYTLLPGTNHIGILMVPFGYSAFNLMQSVGLDAIQSVRRFDTTTGAWQTVAVRRVTAEDESVVDSLIGHNFTIQPGDGLVITMRNRVDGWLP